MKRIIILIFALILSVLLFSACTDTATIADTESVGSESPIPEDFDISQFFVTVGGEKIFICSKSGEPILYLPSAFPEALWGIDATVNESQVKAGESAEWLINSDEIDVCGIKVKIMRSASIPSLFLTSDDGSFDLINSSADHSYGSGGAYALLSDSGELISAGRLKKIRGRGNATWNGTEKKPYQIELTSKKSLLGLAKAKKYILLANYYDPSLLRNRFALEMALGFEGYSPAAVPVDLYAHGSYLGSYLLCEKIEIGEEKIDIFDLEKQNKDILDASPHSYERGGDIYSAEKGSAKWFEFSASDAVSGGFILEAEYPERYPAEASGFVTERGLPIVIVSPEEASIAQVEYIKDYVCAFEDALYSEDGYNSSGKHYSEYADVDSFIFRYLFEEFMLNIDGGISSFHIYKDSEERGGKLVFSCVWDYDCALGNYNKFADLTSPELLFAAESESRNNGSMPSWFYALVSRPEMGERIAEYYREVFRERLIQSFETLPRFSEEIRASAMMDHSLYPHSALKNFYGAPSGRNYDEAYAYLCNFIEARIAFFDNIYNYKG